MPAVATDAPPDPPLTRGHKKRQRTRRQLIEAAIAVIAERGEAFTASDVTAQAGMSNGTFYNYFDDRDALIDAVVPEVIGAFAARNEALVVSDDPALRFAIITARALRRAESFPDDIRVLLRLDAAQRLIVDGAAMEYLRANLAEGVAAGRFSSDVDERSADVVAGTILFAHRRIISGSADDDYVEQIVGQLVRSLGVEPADAAAVASEAVATAAEIDRRNGRGER